MTLLYNKKKRKYIIYYLYIYTAGLHASEFQIPNAKHEATNCKTGTPSLGQDDQDIRAYKEYLAPYNIFCEILESQTRFNWDNETKL